MKNPTEKLKEIKTLLFGESVEDVQASETEVKLAQMKLEDGTILEAEAFEADNEVFIITEDEKIALPVGEYALEDGQILVIEEEGIIKEIKSADAEEEAPVEEVTEEAEVEASEEVKFATMDDLNELKAMVSELKDMMAKEQLAKQEAKEEVEKLIEEAQREELSAPAAEPLKPTAEKSAKGFQVSAKRQLSTRDRVLARISQIKNK